MGKTNQTIKFKGNGVSVLGASVEEGVAAPNFKLTGTDMSDVELSKFAGKVLVVLSMPSVDTPVCATETRKFNELATNLSSDVSVLGVTLDLPFALSRWCAAEGVENVQTASDYKHRSFGENYGVYVQDIGLLARAVFVIDKSGTVAHVEYVDEIAEEPDYDAVIAKVKELAA